MGIFKYPSKSTLFQQKKLILKNPLSQPKMAINSIKSLIVVFIYLSVNLLLLTVPSVDSRRRTHPGRRSELSNGKGAQPSDPG